MKLTLFAATIASWSLLKWSPATAQPELMTAASTTEEMVVTANFQASEAGAKVLADGGTAADAFVVVQTMLGLVEPQSSGIAGGAFVVYYDGASGNLTTFDAREKAPLEATEERFIDPDTGETLDFYDAWQTGLSVGPPGVPALMEFMHQRYGQMPWADLFEPAKTVALEGFEVTNRMEDNANTLLDYNRDLFQLDFCGPDNLIFFRDPVAYDYFIDNTTCAAKTAGTVLTNQEYADMMDLFAAEGAAAFYEGTIAEAVVAKAAADRNPTGDATITLEDLLQYEVIERPPVCKTYRGMYNICGMGPPSSGALAVGQIMGILENFDLSELSNHEADTVHLFTQAGRLAFADRGLYVGDSDFITVPVEGMLDPDYLTERAGTIMMDLDMGSASAGVPPGAFDPAAPQMKDFEKGTSHISIVDQYGNALSCTTTVESFFGSGLMTNGFLLNNQITDFSFSPTDADGVPIANRVQPGKRPRSSMSPTIVLTMDGELAYLTGSPGGSRIIGYTAQSLLSMLEFGLDPQEAANTAHYQNRNGDTELEANGPGVIPYDLEALTEELEARNHTVSERVGEASGLSIIQVTPGGFLGGADPRRDGTAVGRTVEDPGMPTMSPVEPMPTMTPDETMPTMTPDETMPTMPPSMTLEDSTDPIEPEPPANDGPSSAFPLMKDYAFVIATFLGCVAAVV